MIEDLKVWFVGGVVSTLVSILFIWIFSTNELLRPMVNIFLAWSYLSGIISLISLAGIIYGFVHDFKGGF